MAEAKNLVGRPKFEITEEILKKTESLMAKGLTKEQCAGMLGVSVSTFMLYQAENSEFSEAIKRGQSIGIDQVTNALYEKATVDKDNTAIIFYLKNRAGWVDKQEVQSTVEQRHVIDLTGIPNEQLQQLEQVFEQSNPRTSESGEVPQIIEGVYEG
tara:strand:- start:361 stop:828 length:468 start_codon:yes stop_codon:yes gene_type:complete